MSNLGTESSSMILGQSKLKSRKVQNVPKSKGEAKRDSVINHENNNFNQYSKMEKMNFRKTLRINRILL